MIDLFARSKSNSAARLWRPVTVPTSCHPFATAFSGEISFFRGPSPTLVTKDLKTTSTSSTLFGPIPTSAHIADAVTSFDVTYGYVPCHNERNVPWVPSTITFSFLSSAKFTWLGT